MKKLQSPYRQILTVLRDFLILVAIGNLLYLFIAPGGPWTANTILTNCLFSIGIGYPAWKGMTAIIILLERKLPWLRYPVKRLIVQLVVLTLFAGLVIFGVTGIWIGITQGFDAGSILQYILPSLKVVYIFMISALVLGNAVLFFKNWREATIRQEELKRAHLALQYQSLRDQVRPHFLFNSLSSLVTLIQTDTAKATEFVHKLSDVYRYLLEQREQELVSLDEEIGFLEDYIYLQKIRLGECLQVDLSINRDRQRMVIPLSLQMIVENAIKHNEASAEFPLLITLSEDDQGNVVIRNNLQRKVVIERSPGLGIDNLRKRMAFYTDRPLEIEENGEDFTVRIPTISR